jgi:hypothetical protein
MMQTTIITVEGRKAEYFEKAEEAATLFAHMPYHIFRAKVCHDKVRSLHEALLDVFSMFLREQKGSSCLLILEDDAYLSESTSILHNAKSSLSEFISSTAAPPSYPQLFYLGGIPLHVESAKETDLQTGLFMTAHAVVYSYAAVEYLVKSAHIHGGLLAVGAANSGYFKDTICRHFLGEHGIDGLLVNLAHKHVFSVSFAYPPAVHQTSYNERRLAYSMHALCSFVPHPTRYISVLFIMLVILFVAGGFLYVIHRAIW